jgi:radical SAM/SPASM domain protein of ACGX system
MTPYPYFAIQWHITDVCDQRCKHCYIFSEGHPDLISTPWKDMERTLSQILEFCIKIRRTPYIYLTGGDPILHPDFWKLLELFHKNNVRFCIMGNPFHLTDEVCGRMKELGCVKYQLSLDGLEKTHDSFRKPGSFQTTLEKIPVIKNAGMWCAVMTTVSKTNMDEIPALIDLVDKLGVDVYAVGRYCPTSVEKAYDEHIHIPPAEYRAFLEKCWSRYEAHKDSKTTFQLKDHLWTLFLYEKGLYKLPAPLPKNTPVNKNEGGRVEMTDGCNCGRNHITILPNGDIYACRRMESKVGNIRTDDLYDVWTGDNMNGFRQYEKFTKCVKCELFAVCRGCPSVSYGYTHDMYSPDPQCWKDV